MRRGMTTAKQILQHLQSLYPGQLVLYPPQLAQVLGKSEKALSHLISRGNLPFEPKTIGGRNCVDIYQIAEWLASDSMQASTPLDSIPSDKKTTSRPTRKTVGSRKGLGGRLMQMRHEAAIALKSISVSGANEFLGEIAWELLLGEPPEPARIVVTYFGQPNGNNRQHTKRCTTLSDAAIYVIELKRRVRIPVGISVECNSAVLYTDQQNIESDDGSFDIGFADKYFLSLLEFIASQRLDDWPTKRGFVVAD